MKLLIMMITLLSTSAFAQIEYDEERVAKRDHISVQGLNCILPLGRSEDVYTKIDSVHLHPEIGLKMKHSNVAVMDCDREVLSRLSIDSAMRFGFVSVEIEYVKRTAKKPRMVFGKCQRNYQEEVIYNFDYGLTLRSGGRGMLIPAQGC